MDYTVLITEMDYKKLVVLFSFRNAKKSQEKIKSLEADIEKITGNINQLEEEREQLKDEITSITDEQDKAQVSCMFVT